MTGDDLRKARATIGKLWGWPRPVFATELGRALGNPARDPGEAIRYHEARRDEPIPWDLAAAVRFLERTLPDGGVPQRLYDRTVRRDRRRRAA